MDIIHDGKYLVLLGTAAFIVSRPSYFKRACVGVYKAGITLYILGERLMGRCGSKDRLDITFFDGNESVGAGWDPEREPQVYTHFVLDWKLGTKSGTSVRARDDPLLDELREVSGNPEALQISERRLLSATGIDSLGREVRLNVPAWLLAGDVVFGKVWRRHFKTGLDIVKINAIDSDINMLTIGEEGLQIADTIGS